MVDKSLIFLDRIAKIISHLEEDEIGWEVILETFGFDHLLEIHDRLLRSQHYGDEDYSWCITNVFKDAYKENPTATRNMIIHILKNDLVHKDDIEKVQDAIDTYPGLRDFLYQGISSSDKINNTNLTSKSVKVFISYSMKDKLVGAEIKSILADFEIESFMAHDDIFVSEEWKERILIELKEANVFIPILSKNFKDSDWCSQESGIACCRDILIIPVCLDDIRPYGFMNHRQGKKISRDNIPLNYIIKPIADNFPAIDIIDPLINQLSDSHSFRNAEYAMSNLEPYFDILNDTQINRVIAISIENNQIWAARKCYGVYLPKFIKIHRDKIENTNLERILELIERDV